MTITHKNNSRTSEHLRKNLNLLKNNKIPDNKLYSILHEFGDNNYLDAKKEVERHLNHHDPTIRYISLNVLSFHWGCKEHINTCISFIENDIDEDNQRIGLSALGSLQRNTKDPKGLSICLKIMNDAEQEFHIRDTAYTSMLDILGIERKYHPSAVRDLDYSKQSKDINWNWVEEAEKIVKKAGLR